jgi:S-DNA-T family DNA segregation ATPase FtsK/SpoIIIE
MATKKKTSTKKSTASRKSTANNSKSVSTKAKVAERAPQESAEEIEARRRNPDSPRNLVILFGLIILTVLSFVFLFFTKMAQGLSGNTGPIGYAFCCLFFGLLGPTAYLLPFALLYLVIFRGHSLRQNTELIKPIALLVLLVCVASAFQLAVQGSAHPAQLGFGTLWKDGISLRGGGIIGGFVGGLLYLLLKKVSWFFLIPFIIADLLLLAEITPSMIAGFFRRLVENFRAYIASRPERAQKPQVCVADGASPAPVQKKNKRQPPLAPSNPPEADTAETEPTTPAQPVTPKKAPPTTDIQEDTIMVDTKTGEVLEPIYTEKKTTEQTLSEIYTDPPHDEAIDRLDRIRDRQAQFRQTEFNSADLDLTDRAPWEEDVEPLTTEEEEIANTLLNTEREPVAEDTLPEHALNEEPAAPVYQFPPITLLSQNINTQAEDSSEELRRNAEKLVSVLRSFRVSTEIVNVSRGPTITRYELAPKEGVRVRSIANLVDDIALNLETSGVRIEAPIPGKAAVGIEVPNKSPATVYLRELLENNAFTGSKSKVTCALGMDVAGTPIYLDIAKMPHLLIAGATGMGKSVCINSLIVSLLYKASPDEVKLILIDPKKVELNVYNKLPHLLVPVVNLPKKAAGSLSWAVGEMERRFELIEEVGVRDIKGYNQVTADDPAKEFLPHIIIIIDELADLMMTAPDDVEESICRLAQKARAAGMHLIIGTQRPSVDVITGLIKANIPSRIAFTVASNIDSRTIIDVAGAEKLIGRGDMLYAPVGAMKPIRVQGSFVSDKEVEAVCDFIRAQAGEGEYNSAIMEEIDKNAEQCGQTKKKGAGAELGATEDDGELDPKFNDAVEVALETGKVSTSLLQRRLSIGYGRAAKIIDHMQSCGIVGPQEGQKPRNILISYSDWNEIKMRNE